MFNRAKAFFDLTKLAFEGFLMDSSLSFSWDLVWGSKDGWFFFAAAIMHVCVHVEKDKGQYKAV